MINFHKLVLPQSSTELQDYGLPENFELRQHLKDSKIVKSILLSFNPAFVLETVMKKDYHRLLKNNKGLNVENMKRLTVRKACDVT